MLYISHPQINVWDLWSPAMWTSCQVSFHSFFLSPCMVQSHFCRGMGGVDVPYPTLSPDPKANNLPWSLCHLSLHCCPSTQRRWALPALPQRWQGLCLSPSPTHSKGTEGTGNAHARCHTKQNRRPVGEMWAREKDGGGKSWGKESETKKSIYSSWGGGTCPWKSPY